MTSEPEEQPVPEIEVLITTSKWLHANGWELEAISLPRGKGIDQKTNTTMIKAAFNEAGIPLNQRLFTSHGEDIRASLGNVVWKIECKGLGSGRYQTDRNNLDRAIASTVSYYTRPEGLRLGLALPEYYKRFFPDRLPHALRQALNLYVLLYAARDELWESTPEEQIP